LLGPHTSMQLQYMSLMMQEPHGLPSLDNRSAGFRRG
jgi:hypothetical protein